jgi:hypothetical protein
MSGWNDGQEAVVGSDGQAYFAPTGTTLPAKNSSPTAALAAAWLGGGFVSDDGFTQRLERTVAEIRAFQSLTPIRRAKESENIALVFALLQWNETNLPFALGGGTVTDQGGGKWSYDYPDPASDLDERAFVMDITDASKHYRFVFPRGNVSEPVESKFARGQAALLPVTFSILSPSGGGSPGYIITDDPNFAAGS